jgi:hypothetical protein
VTEIENLRISITLPDAQNAPHLFVRGSLLLNSGLVTELRIRNKSINTPYMQQCTCSSRVHIGTCAHDFVILIKFAKC